MHENISPCRIMSYVGAIVNMSAFIVPNRQDVISIKIQVNYLHHVYFYLSMNYTHQINVFIDSMEIVTLRCILTSDYQLCGTTIGRSKEEHVIIDYTYITLKNCYSSSIDELHCCCFKTINLRMTFNIIKIRTESPKL
jgi:hypothetical protein